MRASSHCSETSPPSIKKRSAATVYHAARRDSKIDGMQKQTLWCHQYCPESASIPGAYGIWDTLEFAISEKFSSLHRWYRPSKLPLPTCQLNLKANLQPQRLRQSGLYNLELFKRYSTGKILKTSRDVCRFTYLQLFPSSYVTGAQLPQM